MEKTRVTVRIGGHDYVIAGNDSEEHVKKVAGLVDDQIRELKIKLPNSISDSQTAVLAAMNLADELLSAKAECRRLRHQLNDIEEKKTAGEDK